MRLALSAATLVLSGAMLCSCAASDDDTLTEQSAHSVSDHEDAESDRVDAANGGGSDGGSASGSVVDEADDTASGDGHGNLSHDGPDSSDSQNSGEGLGKSRGSQDSPGSPGSSNVEFVDWLPELGPADTSDPDFEFFNPCTEISEEEFEAAGLYDPFEQGIELRPTFEFCSRYTSMDPQNFRGEAGKYPGAVSFAVDDLTEKKLVSDNYLLDMPNLNTPEAIHFQRLGKYECVAGFETVGGRIGVGYSETPYIAEHTLRERCAIAYHYLEKLFIK